MKKSQESREHGAPLKADTIKGAGSGTQERKQSETRDPSRVAKNTPVRCFLP